VALRAALTKHVKLLVIVQFDYGVCFRGTLKVGNNNMRLVSITPYGDAVLLRRYEENGRGNVVCTHVGTYDEGVTPNSIYGYRDYGAPQDMVPEKRRRLTA